MCLRERSSKDSSHCPAEDDNYEYGYFGEEEDSIGVTSDYEFDDVNDDVLTPRYQSHRTKRRS